MSKFKVGDRARLINCPDDANPEWWGCEGDEVEILGLPGSVLWRPYHYSVSRPAHWVGAPSVRVWTAPPEDLSPLLPDSAADEFIARIKKLGREPIVPLVPVREAK